MSRESSGAVALLWCAVAALAPAGPATAEPRPLSAAERHAAELAALYLDQGPAAWWPRLAGACPLRALGRAAALDEIAARAGPPEGALWRLETPGPAAGEGAAVIAALRSAVAGFRRMAGACRAGDLGRARRELAAAERELQRAASLLRPYGLQP